MSEDSPTSSTATRKEVPNYLACHKHSNREAEQVCGDCGTPVCDDCSTSVPDISLRHYERGGLTQAVKGLVLLLGVPLLLEVFAPGLVGDVMGLVFETPVYLKGSLVTSAILVGIAYLALVRYRSRHDLWSVDIMEIGDVIGDFELVVRRSGNRTVCDECKRDKQFQRYLLYGVTLVSLLLVAYGLYRSLPNMFFLQLKYSGIGVALYLVRKELVAFAVDQLQSERQDGPVAGGQ